MGLLSICITSFLVSLSGALSPGPLTALALTEGPRAGRWTGAKLSLGHALVEAPLVIAIAYGLGYWLNMPLVGAIIGILGGAVLAWMGWSMALNAWQGRLSLNQVSAAKPSSARGMGLTATGGLLSISNPYWSLWWASIGAGFIFASQQYGLLGIAAFYIAHWLTDLIWLTFLSFLTASGSKLIGDKLYRALLVGCGLFLLAFSVYFFYTGVRFAAQV